MPISEADWLAPPQSPRVGRRIFFKEEPAVVEPAIITTPVPVPVESSPENSPKSDAEPVVQPDVSPHSKPVAKPVCKWADGRSAEEFVQEISETVLDKKRLPRRLELLSEEELDTIGDLRALMKDPSWGTFATAGFRALISRCLEG